MIEDTSKSPFRPSRANGEHLRKSVVQFTALAFGRSLRHEGRSLGRALEGRRGQLLARTVFSELVKPLALLLNRKFFLDLPHAG